VTDIDFFPLEGWVWHPRTAGAPWRRPGTLQGAGARMARNGNRLGL